MIRVIFPEFMLFDPDSGLAAYVYGDEYGINGNGRGSGEGSNGSGGGRITHSRPDFTEYGSQKLRGGGESPGYRYGLSLLILKVEE